MSDPGPPSDNVPPPGDHTPPPPGDHMQPTGGPPPPAAGYPPQAPPAYPPQAAGGYPPPGSEPPPGSYGPPPPGYGPPPPGYGPPPPGYGPPPPGYGAPAYQPGPYGQKQSNGLAIASLILGLAAALLAIIVFGGLVGVVGLVFGIMALGRAKRLQGTGRGLAITGIILNSAGIVVAVIVLVAGALFVTKHVQPFQHLGDCLAKATTAADRQACQDQFANDLLSPTPTP